MHTYTDHRALDDRTDDRDRPIGGERLARLSGEMVTPWQLPEITREPDAIAQVTPLETNYVVAWQLTPIRPKRLEYGRPRPPVFRPGHRGTNGPVPPAHKSRSLKRWPLGLRFRGGKESTTLFIYYFA